jgi:hypothetical protein
LSENVTGGIQRMPPSAFDRRETVAVGVSDSAESVRARLIGYDGAMSGQADCASLTRVSLGPVCTAVV